jgi:hypothetical protein
MKQPEGTATAMAGRGQFFTSFSVIPGKKGDDLVDSSSLTALRDSVPKLFAQPAPDVSITKLDGPSRETTIAGEDALVGKFIFILGTGRYAVFFHGDKYYVAIFLNLGSVMGETYVEEDFQKFLSGFRFM